MRLKLIIGVSLLAAVLGAGSCIAVLLAFFSRQNLVTSPSLLVLATFLLPTAAIVLGSLFVYRHTSRRRKLQAFMTLVLSTILTITFFVVTSIITTRIDRDVQPPTSPIAFNLS